MSHGERRGSVFMGMVWMLVLSLLLFWLPVLGPLAAGIVGGTVAGSVGRGILAFFLPGIILAVVVFFLGGLLAGLPVLGFLAGLGVMAAVALGAGPMLLGAILGGLLA